MKYVILDVKKKNRTLQLFNYVNHSLRHANFIVEQEINERDSVLKVIKTIA